MRHAMTLALLVLGSTVFSPSTRAASVGETWSEYGVFFEMAEIDGQAGLDFVIGYTSNGRIELRHLDDGSLVYEFPIPYREDGYGSFLGNLDTDPDNEFVVFYLDPADPHLSRIGLFEPTSAVAGESADAAAVGYGMTWEIPFYGFIGYVTAGDFESSGRRDVVVVAEGFNFRIHDSLDGTVKYDWALDGPGRLFQSLQILDVDQDGRDELLVVSDDIRGSIPKLHVLEATAPVGVGDGPAFEARLLGVQSAPNPFSGPAQIAFTLPARGRVTVMVYDAAGRLVRKVLDESRGPGRHDVSWDGRDAEGRAVQSGVYFYEVEAAGQRVARKMMRVR